MKASLLAATLLAALGCRPDARARHDARAQRSEAVTRAPRRADPALTGLDERLHALERIAAARTDDWIHWERVALGYMDRARMSGDYGDYARAERALSRAFQNAPRGVGPFLTRARFNFTVHRVGRVEADLEALRYALLRPDERAAIAHLRAEVALHSGRYADARRAYEEALARDRDVASLVGMAQLQWKTGHFTEADALVREAEVAATRADDGVRAWVCLVRGTLENDRGRWDAALAAFRAGLRVQPRSWVFEEHVAEVLSFTGHDEQARLMYVDLVERTGDPEFMDMLAQIDERRGDDASARSWAARAMAGYESRLRIMPEATAGHAIEFFMRRDPVRAVPIAEMNRDARPGGEAQEKLAAAYLGAGRIADAQRVLEATLATPWNTAALHAIASRVFARTGDALRSQRERALALALNPHAEVEP